MHKAFCAIIFAAILGLPAIASGQATASAVDDKVMITTVSAEARALYIQARDLNANLRAEDARPIYRAAIAKDPTFAMAHYGLALTAESNEEFFESLQRAVTLSDGVSVGEQLMIRALDAGVRGEPTRQIALLTELVQKFPNDERAHNLLGNAYQGRQEYDRAIVEFRRAIEIAPEFTPPYNSLGYTYRAKGDNGAAEEAFLAYIERLPNEPNPFDSHAELLMKMGRHDESIAAYRKALAADPTFTASSVGIATNQMLMGQGTDARATLQGMYDSAQNSGIQREALLWTAASYLHESNRVEAMKVLDRRLQIATGENDYLSLSNDYQLMGDVQLWTGNPVQAATMYAKVLEAGERADVPEAVKAGIRRNDAYNATRVALVNGDVVTAETSSEAYHAAIAASQAPFEVRQEHEILGRIALAQGDADVALTHFQQANQQDPEVLYAMSQAYQVKGDSAGMRRMAELTTNFNQLSFAYGYVRPMGQEMLAQN
jgi:tetratricopeptide (TPR) repeat protein